MMQLFLGKNISAGPTPIRLNIGWTAKESQQLKKSDQTDYRLWDPKIENLMSLLNKTEQWSHSEKNYNFSDGRIVEISDCFSHSQVSSKTA